MNISKQLDYSDTKVFGSDLVFRFLSFKNSIFQAFGFVVYCLYMFISKLIDHFETQPAF